MPDNSAGTYTLPNDAPINGQTGDADPIRESLEDIQDGLTARLMADGTKTPTANQPMGGFIHTNVGNASALTNYASAAQVTNSSLTYGGVAAGTADALTIAPSPGIAAYAIGQMFQFKVSGSANTGAATLNVNSIGAGAITWPDGTALGAGNLPANAMVVVVVQATTPVFHLVSIGSELALMRGGVGYAAASGTDTITATLAPPLSAYAVGMTGRLLIANTNTGAVTLALNGLTAGDWKRPDGTALIAGDLVAGAIAEWGIAAVSAGTPTFHLLSMPAGGLESRVLSYGAFTPTGGITVDSIPSWVNTITVKMRLLPTDDGVTVTLTPRKSSGTDITAANGVFLYGDGTNAGSSTPSSGAAIILGSTIKSTANTGGLTATVTIYDCQGARYKWVDVVGSQNAGGTLFKINETWIIQDTNPITGVKIETSSSLGAGRYTVIGEP